MVSLDFRAAVFSVHNRHAIAAGWMMTIEALFPNAVTAEVALQKAIEMKPKHVVVVMVDVDGRQTTLTSYMNSADLSFLAMSLQAQVLSTLQGR